MQSKQRLLIDDLLPLSKCGLFDSQTSRLNIIQNFKKGKLFRKILEPIQTKQNEPYINYQEEDWLSRLSCIQQTSAYTPKKIIANTQEDYKQNMFEQSLILKKKKFVNKGKKRTINDSLYQQKQMKQIDKFTYSFHIQRQKCNPWKINIMKKQKPEFVKQKWTNFEEIWPQIRQRSFQQSVQKLKNKEIKISLPEDHVKQRHIIKRKQNNNHANIVKNQQILGGYQCVPKFLMRSLYI